MADEFIVSLGAELSKNIDLQKDLDKISKGLRLTIDNVTINKESINTIKAELSKVGTKLDLDFSVNTRGAVQQAEKAVDQIQRAVNKALTPLSELKTGTEPIKAVLDDKGFVDLEKSLDKIKEKYSEFGQVKLTNKLFDQKGNIDTFRVNIEQVNGDLKETRNFMMKLSGKEFSFPDNIIKGSESFVQHLNESKNITNATGDEINAINKRLQEQKKYYSKIKSDTKTLYDLQNRLVSAGELETEEIEKQVKATKQRISYSEKQLDKKGLRDESLDKQITDLEVIRQRQLDIKQARIEDLAITKDLNSELSKQAALILNSNKAYETNSIGRDVSTVSTKFNRLSSKYISPELSTQYTLLINKAKEFKEATSDTSRANIYKELLTLLPSVSNQIDILNSKQKQENDITEQLRDNLLANMNSYKSLNSKLWSSTKDGNQDVIDLRNRWDTLTEAIKNADKVKLSGLAKELSTLKLDIKSAGYQAKSFSDLLKENIGKFSNWFFIGGGVASAVRSARQIYQNVYELDTAMTSLYKVTDETDTRYNQFLKNSSANAKELGRTISSLVTQTSEWAKLGFSLSESEQLSKISSIYSNVGEVDDKTAVSDMVTAMKAFNIQASDSIKIIDIYNKLGNEFAVTSAGIGQGVKNSASALALQGNSLEQVVAMLTGGGEITQNVGELGNMLKVASLRLASMKGKLQEIGEEYEDIESVSKNQTIIYDKTKGQVDILDKENGKLKNTYTILKEISSAWDDVDNLDRNDLLELMFGKNRANQGAAIIKAFQSGQIDKAYEAALNADGSAMKEQERWLGSLEAKIQQFQAAYQSLSNTLLDSEVPKFFVDLGTGVISAVDGITQLIGSLNLLIGAVGGVLSVKGMG